MAKFDDLWRNEQTLQAVLDNISDGVLTYDRDMRITGANRAAEAIQRILVAVGRPARAE